MRPDQYQGCFDVDEDGRPADDFGCLAVAAKVCFAKTQTKVGEWVVTLPVIRSDDGRSLPQTFRGAQITSRDKGVRPTATLQKVELS